MSQILINVVANKALQAASDQFDTVGMKFFDYRHIILLCGPKLVPCHCLDLLMTIGIED